MPAHPTPPTLATRLEHVLGVPLAADALRQWPQSRTAVRGRARIAHAEPDAAGYVVARRHACGHVLVVEWSVDYGDGHVHRNVTVAELVEGVAVRVTDYWGTPGEPPEARDVPTEPLPPEADELWPAAGDLTNP